MANPMTRTMLAGATAIGLVLSGVGTAAAQSEQPGEGTSFSMARATWDTGWFTAEIYRQMLQELGYEVGQPTTLDAPAFYQAVGQGDVTGWVNGWFPLHNTYEDNFSGGAEKVGYVAEGGALQGYLADAASVEEYGIETIADFKKDEIKEAFDRNGDGKADLVACPPGWGCEELINYQLDAFELRDHVNAIQANYSASMADAVAAYQQGDPIFFYTWTPNWTVNELVPGEDVMWLETPSVELPEDQQDLADAATVEGVEGCANDPCQLGMPANDIQPVVNTEFLNNNPAARTLFEEASIPLDAIFAQNAEMNDGADSEEDIVDQASQWISDNQDQVDEWLNAAREAASQ